MGGADREDVKAPFDRIAKPPQGITFRAVSCLRRSADNARDKYTIEFNCPGASSRRVYLCPHCQRLEVMSQENARRTITIIFAKSNLPGTGISKLSAVSRTKLSWKGTRTTGTRAALPRGIDSITPRSPTDLGSGVLSGSVSTKFASPIRLRPARPRHPGLSTTPSIRALFKALGSTASAKPFDDPRAPRFCTSPLIGRP